MSGTQKPLYSKDDLEMLLRYRQVEVVLKSLQNQLIDLGEITGLERYNLKDVCKLLCIAAWTLDETCDRLDAKIYGEHKLFCDLNTSGGVK